MSNASGNPTGTAPTYSPALLSAMLNATADNLDTMVISDVVVEALRSAMDRGRTSHLALNDITWALRDVAAICDNMTDPL
jgi:hypothetical protein